MPVRIMSASAYMHDFFRHTIYADVLCEKIILICKNKLKNYKKITKL